MNDVETVKSTLHELATHMYVLATGLQNAAPPGPIPASVQYLLEAAAHLENISVNVEKLLQDNLLEIIRQTIERDESLRAKYHVENKFRFVRDRLQQLFDNIEKEKQIQEVAKVKSTQPTLAEDEMLVYVYLFNAHGAQIRSWQNMLIPKVFYEYSVNRPIYAEKAHVESVIRSKANKAQHAFLTIAIKINDVIHSLENVRLKDQYGNETLRIREGALQFERFISLTHNDVSYGLNEVGELVKKDD